MPRTEVHVFQDSGERVPQFLDWLNKLEQKNKAAHKKCIARILKLSDHGSELRRPIADYLADGIYELRFKVNKVQYRILYFFHGRNVVVLSHGITKTKKVPPREIAKAKRHRDLIRRDYDAHTTTWS